MESFRIYYLGVIAPATLILLAIFITGVALKVILGKHPVVLNMRWLFVLMCILLLPNFFSPIFLIHSRDGSGLVSWMGPVIAVGALSIMWFHWRGFLVLGISSKGFKEELFAAAGKLGMTLEESLGSVRIKDTGEVIQVSVQSWAGSAHLRGVDSASQGRLLGLIQGLVSQYSFAGTRGNKAFFWGYLAVGVGILITSASLLLNVNLNRLNGTSTKVPAKAVFMHL